MKVVSYPNIFRLSFYCIVTAALSSFTGYSQTYIYNYAAFSGSLPSFPADNASGTGSFVGTHTVPDFTWSAATSSAKLNSVNYTLPSDEMPDANAWESQFGNITTSTPCLRTAHVGNSSSLGAPLAIPITITISFNSPTNPAGWGFMLLDLDVDQVDIAAKDPSGAAYSNAEIDSWFKGGGDANSADGLNPTCWDATNATIVGGFYVNSPCMRNVTLGGATSDDGSFGYFEPDMPLSSLQLTFYDLQATTGSSIRLFIAAIQTLNITGNVYLDGNGLSDNTVNGTPTNNAGGDQLYTYLVNGSGLIVDSAHVTTSGSYSFHGGLNATTGSTAYTTVLSSNQYAIGEYNPVPALPTNWLNTGEHLGSGPGSDEAINGRLPLSVGSSNILNANFGIATIALPVKLISFSALPEHKSVFLKWSTVYEDKFRSFIVERAAGYNSFIEIGEVPSLGGNTGNQTDYTWTDIKSLTGVTYYRLKMVDIDGNYEYSVIRSVKMDEGVENIIIVYPNPVKNTFRIAGLKSAGVIKLYHMNGQLLFTDKRGTYTAYISIEKYPPGIYSLVVTNETGKSTSIKIVKSYQ